MIATDRPLARPAMVGTDALFVTDDDFLLVTSINAAATVRLTIGGRLLRRDGTVVPLAEAHTPNTDRTAATSAHKLAEGWLQSVTVIATAASVHGLTFVRIDLCRGQVNGARVPIATLAQGIVTSAQRLAWPGSPLAATHERDGALRAVTGTDPAAGAEISEAVPTGARWDLLAISFQLVTDATVANRETALTFDDGATIYFTSPSGFAQTASLTRRYSAAAIGAQTAPAAGTDRQILIPLITLLPGHRIRTATTGIVAGDNYGAPLLLVRETLEGS